MGSENETKLMYSNVAYSQLETFHNILDTGDTNSLHHLTGVMPNDIIMPPLFTRTSTCSLAMLRLYG